VTQSLERFDWSRFLARPRLPSPSPEVFDALYRQPMLITGAGGSIGSALALRLAGLAPARLVLLEASESNLYALKRRWAASGAASDFGGTRGSGPAVPMTPLLGSISNEPLLEHIFSRYAPKLVFHAAAFKHVPLMEEHPLAAISNNIFGTEMLTRVAAAHGARVVLLSTDKAVEPSSVMGATKRVAEQIVLSAGGVVLRLGNVLATRDSVVKIFANQIARGGPITVTDPAARRYFITLDEAVNLLLIAGAQPEPAAVLAPVLLSTHFVSDLAHFMADTLAPSKEIAIDFTGARAGDKDTELLWSTGNETRPLDKRFGQGAMVYVDTERMPAEQLGAGLANLHAAANSYDLAGALAHLRWLVADFRPSHAVQELARQIMLPISL
jgi:FlaA1/EpsC-like NDP-sugar epimerase